MKGEGLFGGYRLVDDYYRAGSFYGFVVGWSQYHGHITLEADDMLIELVDDTGAFAQVTCSGCSGEQRVISARAKVASLLTQYGAKKKRIDS
jgi:hypothetical protein